MSKTVILLAGAVTLVLIALSAGYLYHRDELYFVAAGQHLAWSYADQGPIVPLLARGMSEIAPNSLTALRLPSAMAAGVVVLLTAATARELGGARRAQWIAAACAAVASIVLFTGHLLSTSTFDLLAWSAWMPFGHATHRYRREPRSAARSSSSPMPSRSTCARA